MALHTGISEPRPPMLQRITPHQWVVTDICVAVLFLVGGLLALFLSGPGKDRPHHQALLAVVIVVATVPIALRRRYPIPTLIIVTSALVVATLQGNGFPGIPVVALPLYSVATQYDRRISLIALCTVEAALLAALGLAVILQPTHSDTTFNILLAGATWFVGDSIRARRAYIGGLALQAEQRQQQEVERAQQSIAEERLQIARELHDVVAHSLSVIAIQSGVGRHVLDMQPEETRKALEAVELTSRSALDELRRVLGVLRRNDSDGPELSPAPGIGDLDQLFGQFCAAGVTVDFHTHGLVVPLPTSMDLSVYRIVQEALTNVTKHAGTAQAKVDIDFDDGAVVVTVVNEGNGLLHGANPRPDDEAGRAHHGIVGMRERTEIFGGSLSAGPRGGGGFAVCARIPFDPTP